MLKAENLTLYVNDNGERKGLLNDISFQVEDGEMLVITGPNGGGKSTLAKALMGIEKTESGRIILNGEDITEYDINPSCKGRNWNMHSSSHRDLRGCRYRNFFRLQQGRNYL